MDKEFTKRSNDGITVNKTMAVITGSAISLSIGFMSYIYTNDRADYREDRTEFKTLMRSVSGNVAQLVVNDKIKESRLINMDVRLVKQEGRLEQLYAESKVYWLRSRSYDNK